MVPMALESFRSQDHEPLELVVVDDGLEPIKDLVESIPNCQYIWHPAKNLSEKRNVGIRAAHGLVIAHFDADDWSGPHRIYHQLDALLKRPAARVNGYDRAYWYDFVRKQASKYQGIVWSATMIYWREWALGNPWDETRSFCEDEPFVRRAREKNVLMAMDGGPHFVATMHDRNARRTPGDQQRWPIVAVEQLPPAFRQVANLC
jgi:glycosyltransferase involved in cell wall biosynthesis